MTVVVVIGLNDDALLRSLLLSPSSPRLGVESQRRHARLAFDAFSLGIVDVLCSPFERDKGKAPKPVGWGVSVMPKEKKGTEEVLVAFAIWAKRCHAQCQKRRNLAVM